MTKWFGPLRPMKAASMTALTLVLVGTALPAHAQDTLAEQRLRKMESEIRALQRQVFPGGADGRFFQPEITPARPGAPAAPTAPSSTPVTDMLTRMDSLEAQVARLTAQIEQASNRLTQLEARAAAETAAVTAPPTVSLAAPATATTPAAAPAPAATPAPAPARPAATPAPTAASAAASGPSAQRLAAVRAIEKPKTNDAGDDEYSYGFRLWDAKFYPEAQQQLKMYIDRYPRHSRISYARNLLGRAYLDDGKPREAATWFLQNYQADKTGARAADSLLYLAESMRQLKDTSRACIALAEFAETYPIEAAGRLKDEYDTTRNGVKCAK